MVPGEQVPGEPVILPARAGLEGTFVTADGGAAGDRVRA